MIEMSNTSWAQVCASECFTPGSLHSQKGNGILEVKKKYIYINNLSAGNKFKLLRLCKYIFLLITKGGQGDLLRKRCLYHNSVGWNPDSPLWFQLMCGNIKPWVEKWRAYTHKDFFMGWILGLFLFNWQIFSISMCLCYFWMPISDWNPWQGRQNSHQHQQQFCMTSSCCSSPWICICSFLQ